MEVTGTVAYVATEPPAHSNPVWVKITADLVKENTNNTRVSFQDLVPEKLVRVNVGYRSEGSNFAADVVADGQLAAKVSDLDAVPSWSFIQAFKFPLIVLGGGLLLSIMGGFLVATFRNPRLRRQFIAVVEAVYPLLGRVLRAIEYRQ